MPQLLHQSVPRVHEWFHRVAWIGIVLGTLIWGYGDLVFTFSRENVELSRVGEQFMPVALARSDVDSLELVERYLLAEPVVELDGAGRLVPGDPGRDLEVAPVAQVLGDLGQ